MKLRIVHLLSYPDSERERRSISEVSKLADFLHADYVQLINPVFDGDPPPARECNDRGFELTKAHFGCWDSHRKAITENFPHDLDCILVCECDCVFVEPIPQIADRVRRAYGACGQHDLLFLTFAFKHNSITLERFDDILLITQPVESHCYLLPFKSKSVFEELFKRPWDAYDFCLCHLYDWFKHRIGTFADRPVAVQAVGPSLIDLKVKMSEDHFRAVRYT